MILLYREREREKKNDLYLESIPRDDALMCNEQMQFETHLNTLCQLDNGYIKEHNTSERGSYSLRLNCQSFS